MANRRPAAPEAAAEAPVEETPVETVVETPAPKAAPAPSKGQGGFEGTPDEIHRKYFLPPAGYVKPKFPSSI